MSAQEGAKEAAVSDGLMQTHQALYARRGDWYYLRSVGTQSVVLGPTEVMIRVPPGVIAPTNFRADSLHGVDGHAGRYLDVVTTVTFRVWAPVTTPEAKQ